MQRTHQAGELEPLDLDSFSKIYRLVRSKIGELRTPYSHEYYMVISSLILRLKTFGETS